MNDLSIWLAPSRVCVLPLSVEIELEREAILGIVLQHHVVVISCQHLQLARVVWNLGCLVLHQVARALALGKIIHYQSKVSC